MHQAPETAQRSLMFWAMKSPSTLQRLSRTFRLLATILTAIWAVPTRSSRTELRHAGDVHGPYVDTNTT